MNTTLGTDQKKDLESDKKKTEFHCIICDKYYASYKSFGNHTRSYHSTNKQKAKCEYCGNCFTRKDNLQQHIRLFHSAMQTTFPCKYCGEIFTSRNFLTKHKLDCPQKHLGKKTPLEAHGNKTAEPRTFILYTPCPPPHFGNEYKQSPINTDKPYSPSSRKKGRKPKRISTAPGVDDYTLNNNDDSITNNNNYTSIKDNGSPITNGSYESENDESLEENKALDCHICNTTFLSEGDYLIHKPYCDSIENS